jgi:hypothetical protein
LHTAEANRTIIARAQIFSTTQNVENEFGGQIEGERRRVI